MNRRQLALLLGLLALIAAFRLATTRSGHPWGGDFAQYLQHAENIAEGRPFEETGYIYNPHWPDLGPPRYPPGLPLILAAFYDGAGSDLGRVKVVMNLLSIVSCVVIAFLFTRGLAFRSRAAVTALFGFAPVLWDIKEQIASEHPFLPLYLCAIMLCDRMVRHDRDGERRLLAAAATGAVIYAAYTTRSMALLLVPALGLAALARTRRLGLTAFTAGTVATGLAVVQAVTIPSGAGYLDQVAFTAEHAATNLTTYARGFAYHFGGGPFPALGLGVAAAFAVLAAAGYVRRVRAGRVGTAETFLVLYAFVLLTWRAAQGTRFLMPLFPLLLVWAFEAIEALGRRSTAVFTAACVLAGASMLAGYRTMDLERFEGGIESEGVAETFAFIRERTPADAVFVFRKPRVLSHYCGRRAATLHDGDAAGQWAFVEEIGADYMVVRTEVDESWVHAFAAANADRLREVHVSGGMRVLEILAR